MRLAGVMVSCKERLEIRRQSLESLANTDWSDAPLLIVEDDESESEVHARIRRTWRRAVESALETDAEFLLLMEDDIEFNRLLRRHLDTWDPMRLCEAQHGFFASLYDPGFPMLYRRPEARYAVADPWRIWGAQSYVMSRGTARDILERWGTLPGAPDEMMPRLASRATPIFYHVPSLVQHRGVPSTWGGRRHFARDFDPYWSAPGHP